MAKDTKDAQKFFLLVALLFIVAILSQFGFSAGPGPNYRNYSVDTRVNISGSPPVITEVVLPTAITLTAGELTTVTCNVSVRDYNGGNDVTGMNATFFTAPSISGSPDDNNTHYSNASCAVSGGPSGNYVNYTCDFQVEYYATNGTWTCNASVIDNKNLTDDGSNTTTINALYALNVTPLLDYGEVDAGDIVGNITANVTNLGNLPINITVQGYGSTPGDNLAFICEFGNLTVEVQHFAANDSAAFNDKQVLSSSFQDIFNMTINKTVDGSPAVNSTWWELYIDPLQAAAGGCNGTLVFQAEAV